MSTIVSTSAATAPVGPYSQAVRANGFICASGQIPLTTWQTYCRLPVRARPRLCAAWLPEGNG